MLDVKFVTENLDFVTRKLRERGAEVYLENFEKLTGLNTEQKSLQTDVSTMRHEHQTASKKIGALFKEGNKDEAEALRGRLRLESDAIKAKEDRQREVGALRHGLPEACQGPHPLVTGQTSAENSRDHHEADCGNEIDDPDEPDQESELHERDDQEGK